MREEQIQAAGSALSEVGDIFCRNSRVEELSAVCFRQIEKDFLWQLAVPGSPRRQEQQWILLVDLICLFGFAEKLTAITELGFENCPDFRPDLVATVTNSRSNCGSDISRPGSEAAMHLADAFFDDALKSSPPSGVKHPYSAMFRIDKDDRQAIRRLNGQKDFRGVGDQPVSGEDLPWKF